MSSVCSSSLRSWSFLCQESTCKPHHPLYATHFVLKKSLEWTLANSFFQWPFNRANCPFHYSSRICSLTTAHLPFAKSCASFQGYEDEKTCFLSSVSWHKSILFLPCCMPGQLCEAAETSAPSPWLCWSHRPLGYGGRKRAHCFWELLSEVTRIAALTVRGQEHVRRPLQAAGVVTRGLSSAQEEEMEFNRETASRPSHKSH